MSLEHFNAFLDDAADKARRAILIVVPSADTMTTETAVILATCMVLERLDITEEEFNARLAERQESPDTEIATVSGVE